MTWQAIETAPKDGTDVLLWFGDDVGWISLCVFHRNKWRCAYTLKKHVTVPTHWHPLPSPPTESDEDGRMVQPLHDGSGSGSGSVSFNDDAPVAPPAPGECLEPPTYDKRCLWCGREIALAKTIPSPPTESDEDGNSVRIGDGTTDGVVRYGSKRMAVAPDNAKLVERLRVFGSSGSTAGETPFKICDEAADALEALRKENGLITDLRVLDAEIISGLLAENARLRDALEKIASYPGNHISKECARAALKEKGDA